MAEEKKKSNARGCLLVLGLFVLAVVIYNVLMPERPPVQAPNYEIVEDSIDESDGMRVVFVAVASESLNINQQRAIAGRIVAQDRGENRWTRVFFRRASDRFKQTWQDDCLEAFNGGPATTKCDYSR